MDPSRHDLLAGGKKKPRTRLPDCPRRPEGSGGVPAATKPKPKNHRTSAPGTAKSTPFLPSSGTSKYKKLKAPTSDKRGKKGGKSNGREQPGHGFSKDENRNTGQTTGQTLGSRKRKAGDDNSFRDNDDLGTSRSPDKRRTNGTVEVAQQDASVEETAPVITEAPEVTEGAIIVASAHNGEFLQRASNSSDATVCDDTSGPVQKKYAAAEISVALNGTMEVAQQDATIAETTPTIEEEIPAITEAPEVTEAPVVTESPIVVASA